MQQYEYLQCFTGGGTRFGYYLGSYAALAEHYFAPQAILATCGGSLAAWLVSCAPDPSKLYTIATSSALYEAICPLTYSKEPPYLFAHILQALRRYWCTRTPERLRYLHDEDTIPTLLQELRQYAAFESLINPYTWLRVVADFADGLPCSWKHVAPDVFIGASRLMEEANRVMCQYILFTPMQFVPKRSFENVLANIVPHRQMRQVALFGVTDFQVAVAASIADMYYQAPIWIDKIGYCLGGVMDLLPLEYAMILAKTIFAESKPRYNRYLAEPAILRVFGTPANRRYAQVKQLMQQNVDIHMLPFDDNRLALRGQYVSKSYDWFSGCLKVAMDNADCFAEYMDAQWQYGYNNTLIYLNENL